MSLRRSISALVLAIALMLTGVRLTHPFVTADAQVDANSNDGQVTFQVNPALDDAPVVISEIRIDDKVVPLNEPFDVPADWLPHLTVVVRNVSPKNVIRGGVNIIFPESGRGTIEDPIETQGLAFGRYPSEALFRSDGTPNSYVESNDPISIPPGATLSFFVHNQPVDILAIATRRAGRISKVPIQLQSFYFDNGSRWSKGLYSVPGDQRGQWKIITTDEFRARTM